MPRGSRIMRDGSEEKFYGFSRIHLTLYMYFLSWRQCGQTAVNVKINLLFIIIAGLQASDQIWPNFLQSVSLWPLDIEADELGSCSFSSDIILDTYSSSKRFQSKSSNELRNSPRKLRVSVNNMILLAQIPRRC